MANSRARGAVCPNTLRPLPSHASSIEDKISLMFGALCPSGAAASCWVRTLTCCYSVTDCFDRDGDGTISMEELLTFVDSENGDMLEDLSFIADVVQRAFGGAGRGGGACAGA